MTAVLVCHSAQDNSVEGDDEFKSEKDDDDQRRRASTAPGHQGRYLGLVDVDVDARVPCRRLAQ